jgi:hypothetical protein
MQASRPLGLGSTGRPGQVLNTFRPGDNSRPQGFDAIKKMGPVDLFQDFAPNCSKYSGNVTGCGEGTDTQ